MKEIDENYNGILFICAYENKNGIIPSFQNRGPQNLEKIKWTARVFLELICVCNLEATEIFNVSASVVHL